MLSAAAAVSSFDPLIIMKHTFAPMPMLQQLPAVRASMQLCVQYKLLPYNSYTIEVCNNQRDKNIEKRKDVVVSRVRTRRKEKALAMMDNFSKVNENVA